MLSPARLTLAIDIHSQSYKLLRWIAEAVGTVGDHHDPGCRILHLPIHSTRSCLDRTPGRYHAGQPAERSGDAGGVHVAVVPAGRRCGCPVPARLVLSRIDDHTRGSLSAIRFLYAMRVFAVLSALLVSAGIVLALYVPLSFAAGAWLTSGALLVFAVAGRWIAVREARDLARGHESLELPAYRPQQPTSGA
jgi:hypothetical protein